jgi:alpha-galactosidase
LLGAIPSDADAAPSTADEVALNSRWAEVVFGEPTIAPRPANRLTVVHEDEPGDTKVGRCAFGTPLRLGDKTYTRGIGVNSRSVIRVSVDRPAARFLADIGLDRNVDKTRASVTMHVSAAGQDRFHTPLLRPDGTVQSIEVPLDGAMDFELVVNDGGDGRGWDQADWADARVVLQDGTQLWLDDLARQNTLGTDTPFSFVYDGQHSSAFLHRWRRGIATEAIDTTRRRRTLTLTDPQTRLQVRAVCTLYTDTPGVDWTLYFTNQGERDTPILEQVRAVDTVITLGFAEGGSTPVLHRLRGSTSVAEDWLPFDEHLPLGMKAEFGAVNGRSSADSPFFNVDWGHGGVITAVGWSGQWRGSVEHTKDHALRIQAGMQHLRLSLRPGETIRSPRILQLYWSGADPLRAHNLFRQTMLRQIVPKTEGQAVTPPIAHLSTAFYEFNQTAETNVLSHLGAIQDLGFEMFWLDAYWTRDGFPAGMGHYGFPIERAEPRDRFPRGLRPIGEAVHQAGLGFLMWFEPERVHPGTALAKEHPEWVISPNHDGSGLFNLGLPEARKYMTRYLTTVIEAYRLDCLRIDYNIDPLSFWEFLNRKDTNRVGLGEIRYVEGLYRMWDDLRAAHPRLFIDNCASGGRRIDLETCARAIPLWRSDNTCDMTPAKPATILQAAIKNQVMSAGLNRYLPFSTVGQMGATPYLFRSGFNGGIAFAEDCRPADFPRDLLRQAIVEGKRLRKYWLGNFYPLSAITLAPSDWCLMQYHRPAEGDGIVLGFRREQSPYASYDCELREIDPAAQYEVVLSHSYQPSPPLLMPGEKLRRFRAVIDEKPGSLLLEYRRQDRTATSANAGGSR